MVLTMVKIILIIITVMVIVILVIIQNIDDTNNDNFSKKFTLSIYVTKYCYDCVKQN